MKKLLLLVLCMATGLLGVKAENEAANGLIIEQKDGVSVGFLFADEPVMTYTTTDIVLNGKDFNVSFPMANVAKMTFGDASEYINDVQKVELHNKIGVVYEADGVRVTGLPEGEKVTMHSVDGKLVGSAVADANGVAMVKCNMQGNNPYIVKTNKVTFKFTRK